MDKKILIIFLFSILLTSCDADLKEDEKNINSTEIIKTLGNQSLQKALTFKGDEKDKIIFVQDEKIKELLAKNIELEKKIEILQGRIEEEKIALQKAEAEKQAKLAAEKKVAAANRKAEAEKQAKIEAQKKLAEAKRKLELAKQAAAKKRAQTVSSAS